MGGRSSSPRTDRWRGTLRSLRNRNWALYLGGQAVSHSGTWMQRVGQEWLVLELTGSGAWLGTVAALQFVPLLLLAPWGGLLADRVDKRRLIMCTQVAAGLLALLLGTVVVVGLVRLWMVCALAVALGIVSAVDNPARQSFVLDVVGPDDIQNAVTLHSVVVSGARAIGPAAAGLLIVAVGTGATFLINAASFGVVTAALAAMRVAQLQPSTPVERGTGQLRAGLEHVWATPALRWPLILMAVVGIVAYEWAVSLPLFARFVLGGDARTLGLLNSAMGVGAVVGGLAAAGRTTATHQTFVRTGIGFGLALTATSAAPTLAMSMAGLFLTGAFSIQFIATGNSLMQLHAGEGYRGRVMALWAMAFLGTTPIGAPLIGVLGEVAGGRAPLLVGGVVTFLASVVVGWRLRPVRSYRDDDRPSQFRRAQRPRSRPS